MDFSSEYAKSLDNQDSLKDTRKLFHIPQTNNKDNIYLCGHSLGLQPKSAFDYIKQELNDWKNIGVLGHFDSKNPWYYYNEYLTKQSASIVGALNEEIVVMNSLTVNLHLLLTSFYKPSKDKYKIIIDTPCFSSDRYAVSSHIKLHNLVSEDTLVEISPKKEDSYSKNNDIIDIIEKNIEQTKLILISAVNYYNGQYYNIDKIAKIAKENNCIIGLDLAHAAGNVKLFLHDWEVDFAVWCGYKYLNGGPGAPGAAFIHEKHLGKTITTRLEGWWGHEKESRFNMSKKFLPSKTAEAWQLSNPPILSMASLWASLDIFQKAGMDTIVSKSIKLTSYLYTLLKNLNHKKIIILTPESPNNRGAQISIKIDNFNLDIYKNLIDNGYICDYRSPNVLRIAPVPLYNTYLDVFLFVKYLSKIIK